MEEQAFRWLVRLESDEVTLDDQAAFSEWLHQRAENRAAFDHAKQRNKEFTELAQEALGNTDLVPVELLKPSVHGQGTRARGGAMRAVLRVAAAAALLIALVGAYAFFGETEVEGRPYATARGEQITVTLEDASKVTLNTATEIAVNYHDKARHVVLLKGEALFEVESDPSRPFLVTAGNRSVQAVGTAFTVHKSDEGTIVTVVEGTVAVAETLPSEAKREDSGKGSRPQPPLILSAGELVEIEEKKATVKKLSSEDIEKALSWRVRRLYFHDERLADVVDEFNRYTETQILILNSELADIRVGGVFKTGDSASFLRALENYFSVDAVEVSGFFTLLLPKDDA